MNKAIPAILIILSLALLFVSCNSDNSVDEAFNCTITFNGNGSTAGEMSAQTVGIGKETRLSANAYERTQHLFTGWNTKADGTGTTYEDRQKIKPTDNITLYAQWEIIPIVLVDGSLDDSMKYWTDGNTYTLNSDVIIYPHIEVSGSVTLILKDGYTLTAYCGIEVNEGNSLTIEASGEGTGIIEATGSGGNAGIGGLYNCNSGTIIINGGTVNAISEDGGAGIGGGREGSGGTITINGGIVNAIAEGGGAGIGGGSGGSGGTITINDGTVNASTKSNSSGAGIGGGKQGSGGTITINDGTVNASSGSGGAGIGGGINGSSGTITINGGTVTGSAKDGNEGIGRGVAGGSDGTLTLGDGVSLEVSHDNETWSDYDGTTRKRYMRAK